MTYPSTALGSVVHVRNGEVYLDNTPLTGEFGTFKDELVKELASTTDPKNREYAQSVLQAMGYTRQAEAQHQKGLSNEQMQQIKTAFKDWSGKPDSNQNQVLTEYGFEYENGNSHPKLRHVSSRAITVSGSPSDTNAGKAIARDIIRFLNEQLSSIDTTA